MWLSRAWGHGAGTVAAIELVLEDGHESALSEVGTHPDMTLDVARTSQFQTTN